jgi:microcystin degradation protein MlrC
MTELTKEQLREISKEAALISGRIGAMLVQEGADKRIALLASMRTAAGCSVVAGVDLHSAMTLFMSLYKSADEFFNEKLKDKH